jgi:beta-lactamase class A
MMKRFLLRLPKLKLTEEYLVRKEDLRSGSDITLGLTPGVTRLTLRDLATMMVAVSDNSATNVLIVRVGMEDVKTMLHGPSARLRRLRPVTSIACPALQNLAESCRPNSACGKSSLRPMFGVSTKMNES